MASFISDKLAETSFTHLVELRPNNKSKKSRLWQIYDVIVHTVSIDVENPEEREDEGKTLVNYFVLLTKRTS